MRPSLAFLIVLCAPAVSWAQGDCDQARSVRGPVTEVRVSSGEIGLPSGEALKTPERSERWSYLADRRRITMVKYEAGAFSIFSFPLFSPTTLCEYDHGGRLTRLTFKRNGWTEYAVTTFQYDVKGRLLSRDTRSKGPEQASATTFEYGNLTVTERLTSGAYTVKHLDAAGQVIKQVAHPRAGETEMVTTTTYHRSDLDLKTCSSSNGPASCVTSRHDRWGNVLEERSGHTITATHTYDLDPRGNWTKRVTAKYVDGKPPASAEVTIREIAYRAP